MPLRILRFCHKCLAIRQTLTREVCASCGSELLPFLDDNGAISRDFLVARGSCCDSGCRNCPYQNAATASGKCSGCGQSKVCQRCGAGFECRSGDCWCSQLRLKAATLELLQRTYDNCLCPACLTEFSTIQIP